MNLNKVIEQIGAHKNSDREAVLTKYIQERLNNSLSTYYKELDKSLIYAAARSNSERAEIKVLKKINKERI